MLVEPLGNLQSAHTGKMNGPWNNISIIYIWTTAQESELNFVSIAVPLHRTELILYENRPTSTSALLFWML